MKMLGVRLLWLLMKIANGLRLGDSHLSRTGNHCSRSEAL